MVSVGKPFQFPFKEPIWISNGLTFQIAVNESVRIAVIEPVRKPFRLAFFVSVGITFRLPVRLTYRFGTELLTVSEPKPGSVGKPHIGVSLGFTF